MQPVNIPKAPGRAGGFYFVFAINKLGEDNEIIKMEERTRNQESGLLFTGQALSEQQRQVFI